MESDTNPGLNTNFSLLIENVELYIKLTNNISIPAIILEHRSNDNLNFNLEDLKQLYYHFGNVIYLINKGKKNIVLFKTFLSALMCKLFLEKEESYKINLYNNFHVRWFDLNKDINLIPNNDKELFINISNKNMLKMNNNINVNNNTNTNNNINDINIGVNINMNMNMINNQINNGNNMINPQINNGMENLFSYERNFLDYNNINNINNIMGMQTPSIMNNNNNISMFMNNNNINFNAFNNINNNIGIMNNNYINNNNFINYNNNTNILNNINNINNLNNINYNHRYFNHNHNNHNGFQPNINIKNVNMFEEKVPGKFTCKYEILIENEPEFQVASKLIGSNGYNMKKIRNECNSEVKLRLRGKGSGHKEGPQNKESDEPLHLCVSSKTKEQLNKACFLVNKLFDKINEEYKLFCKKIGIKPKTEKIGRKIEN